MKLEKKLIVCVASASNFHGNEANPSLPYFPEMYSLNTHFRMCDVQGNRGSYDLDSILDREIC
jgi:hypothetical protein